MEKQGAERQAVIDMLSATCEAYQMTGSRYICDPAPTDTDEDYIALSRNGAAEIALRNDGWSENADPTLYDGLPDFFAYRKGEFNVVISSSQNFYDRFVAATELARARNILDKADRITLFQSILYGDA